MAEVDYYRLLQVNPEADPEVIEAAYRQLAKKYHPDVSQADGATKLMQEINEAYDTLRDPSRRATYNARRPAPTGGSDRPSPNASSARQRGNANPGQAGEAKPPHSTPPRSSGAYRLRFGSFRGWTLEEMDREWPNYLMRYLEVMMGDIPERNAIRRYLGIPRSQWERREPESTANGTRAEGRAQGAGRPDTAREKPRSAPSPGEYVLKYGTFAGKRLADVHRADPEYLSGYLGRMFGSTDDRVAIGRFLGVDPLKVRAEYLRRHGVPLNHVSQQPSLHRREPPPPHGGVGVVFALVLAGLFVSISIAGRNGSLVTTATVRPGITFTSQPLTSTPAPNAAVFSGVDAPIAVPRVPTIDIPTVDPRFVTAVAISTIAPLTLSPTSQYTPLPGSWVASAPNITVRFYAVPEWEEKPEFTDAGRLSLGSASDSIDFEAFDLYRFQGISGSSTATAWQSEYAAYTGRSALYNLVITSEPRPQKAAGYDGTIGQFHYLQVSNDAQIDVTMWVGQVKGDRVVMVFRCEPSRDVNLDQAVTQVLATIDFNAR